MKGYKGFNPGLICKDKQYQENTVFEEPEAKICEKGMHFCENPFDVLDYYDLIRSDGTPNEFAEVEALDEPKTIVKRPPICGTGGLTMAKAVLISIRPEWVEKIARGEKTVEVRKTRPKLEPPFKCYIYCTKAPKGWFWFDSPNIRRDGMVIGEFVCDDVKTILADSFVVREDALRAIEGTCLAIQQVKDYAGWEKGMQLCDCEPIYGWHISKLEIYDTPKKLSKFLRPFENCIGKVCDEYGCAYCENGHIKRPPQSWCYVEEQ